MGHAAEVAVAVQPPRPDTMDRVRNQDDREAVMESGVQRYRDALDLFGAVVERLRDDQWDNPTPCTGWSARAVVGHVIHGSRMIMAIAAGAAPVPPATDPASIAGDDPTGAWRARRDEIEQGLGRVDLDAEVATLQGSLRVDDGLGQAVIEPLVHGWDLASATGQPIQLPDHLVVPLLATLEPLDEVIRPSGMFADRQPIANDASAQDRLLSFVGRRP
jgi:uncharacterized protein (TIGR03086 family)